MLVRWRLLSILVVCAAPRARCQLATVQLKYIGAPRAAGIPGDAPGTTGRSGLGHWKTRVR